MADSDSENVMGLTRSSFLIPGVLVVVEVVVGVGGGVLLCVRRVLLASPDWLRRRRLVLRSSPLRLRPMPRHRLQLQRLQLQHA